MRMEYYTHNLARRQDKGTGAEESEADRPLTHSPAGYLRYSISDWTRASIVLFFFSFFCFFWSPNKVKECTWKKDRDVRSTLLPESSHSASALKDKQRKTLQVIAKVKGKEMVMQYDKGLFIGRHQINNEIVTGRDWLWLIMIRWLLVISYRRMFLNDL